MKVVTFSMEVSSGTVYRDEKQHTNGNGNGNGTQPIGRGSIPGGKYKDSSSLITRPALVVNAKQASLEDCVDCENQISPRNGEQKRVYVREDGPTIDDLIKFNNSLADESSSQQKPSSQYFQPLPYSPRISCLVPTPDTSTGAALCDVSAFFISTTSPWYKSAIIKFARV
ncbi:hypothetical protein V9T40_008185 [Parthenolecanium corni]|uniref:Uncharacterized protein n=1 Tax=Parthenolecanium corni TaxID=536013 RepID=A0AAN9TTI3_9HEMI